MTKRRPSIPTPKPEPGDELMHWLGAHPEMANYPLILPDGRVNLSDWADWVRTGETLPGLPSGRPPLLFGEATYADWQVYLRVLKATEAAMKASYAEAAAVQN